MNEYFGEPISVYTREQAIADSVLVDVTKIAHLAGFRVPVAITATVASGCETGSSLEDEGPSMAELLCLLIDAVALVRQTIRTRGDRAGDGPIEMAWRDRQGRPKTLWIMFDAAEGFTLGEPEDF